MLKKKRKGFTIVELVIVIAVIAVLAAVLIPTFTGVVDKANESAALQEVQNAYIDALAQALGSKLEGESFTSENGFTFTFSDETGQNATISGSTEFNSKYPSAKVENGVVVLGPASGGNGGGSQTPSGPDFSALATGGTVTLTADAEISEALAIEAGATATIDLNGKTLTLADPSTENETSDVITVSGTLNITGGSVDIAYPTNEYAYYFNCGICVNEGGTLTISGVNIAGNRGTDIYNEGTVSIENSQFAVNEGGYGVDNEGGTAIISGTDFTVNDGGTGVYNVGGTATITNGEFVANGEDVVPIQCEGGTLNVTGTEFSEGSDPVSYYVLAPIYVTSSGTGTLENVTVTVRSDYTSANLSSSSSLTIKSGSYSGPFGCNSGTITIEDGTFGGIAFADLYAASDDAKNTLCYYPTNKSWVVTCAENVITLSK